jgi:hypothetical protein
LTSDASNSINIWDEISRQPAPNPLKPPSPGQVKLRELEKKLEDLEFALKVLGSVIGGLADFEDEEAVLEGDDEDEEEGEGMDEDEDEGEDENKNESGEDEDFSMKIPMNGVHDDVKMNEAETNGNQSILTSIFQRLSSILLTLSTPTELSFSKVDSNPNASSRPNLISTSTNGSSHFIRAPPSVVELISSINLISLETLSDFILLESKPDSLPKKSIQSLWEGILERILTVKSSMNVSTLSDETNEVESPKKSKKAKGKGKPKEVELDEMEEMKLDFVDIGLKAIWSISRNGMNTIVSFLPGMSMTRKY